MFGRTRLPRSLLLPAVATVVLAVTALVLVTKGKAFKYAAITDPETMDPHAVNSAPVLGFLNNVYEGLVRRDRTMKIEGALAERWEPIGDGEGWRFHLRQGVTFHDGAPFTAEDVLFSYQRATSDGSDVRSWFAPVSGVRIVDDFTVDFLTFEPNPIFPDSIANFMIMDKDWAEEHDTATPSREGETFATLHANGTGAFKLEDRTPGVETTLVPFGDWWGEPEHNLSHVTFNPITDQDALVEALLTGVTDMINPVPLEDIPRLERAEGITVREDIEARVIMLGFNHAGEALQHGGVGAPDSNPFADPRVREAVAHAVDVGTLVDGVMHGTAAPVAQLVSPAMRGYSEGLAERPAHDLDMARALLAEAGYPDGFSFGFACPNDRYINDELVCEAVARMLGEVGLDARLETMPVHDYWPKLRDGDFDIYLLGWSPGTFDAEHPIRFLVATRNDDLKLGSWNFGGYSSPRVDALLPEIQREIDEAKRQAMLDEVARIVQDDVAYVALYVEPLIWGAKSNIRLTQRADNFVILRWVTID